ncbi:LysR substrate-binding domain-containing protein [Nocardia carnea]|uniref:LysR substrate-binding domain-containing protein n=1 Tax=Nocardia carnea TaxID=37328 RepID=UPI002457D35D|nr:LysR substrate-binding domain-containing protein [Nocardia carnea]
MRKDSPRQVGPSRQTARGYGATVNGLREDIQPGDKVVVNGWGMRVLGALPHTQKVSIQTNNITGHSLAARSGLGIAPLPTYIGEADDTLRTVLPDQFSVRRTYWLVMPRDLERSARVIVIERFLRAIVARKTRT